MQEQNGINIGAAIARRDRLALLERDSLQRRFPVVTISNASNLPCPLVGRFVSGLRVAHGGDPGTGAAATAAD